jgi:methyl-accepting chemotaxis protein
MLSTLKIGPRLSLGFGVLLLFICTLSGLGTWQSSRINASVVDLNESWLQSIKQLGYVLGNVNTVRRLTLDMVLESDPAARRKQQASHDEMLSKGLAATLADYEKVVTSPEETRLYNDFKATWTAYLELDRKLVALANSDDPAAFATARALSTGASAAAFSKVLAVIAEDVQLNATGGDRAVQTSAATFREVVMSNIATVGAALSIGIALAFFITRSITAPLNRAVSLASSVAEGDLTVRIESTGKDEASLLLQALSHMTANLERIVGEVRGSSDSIATGSAQIATGNADLSKRTEDQASNLQETAASMEQLSSTVKNSAASADRANQLAAGASEAATRGGEVVGQVVATMQDIAASSKKISDIIGVIDGIAFQTNILALNAAVEAARAGEQGRGFAVVASEVRSLAGRSADAAKEIKSLINASVEKVEIGARQVTAAGSSMDEIVTQVKRVSDLISEISTATAEQSQGIAQVGDAVVQLDKVTQQNAALVEESAAAAESLKDQANRLTAAVSVFRT